MVISWYSSDVATVIMLVDHLQITSPITKCHQIGPVNGLILATFIAITNLEDTLSRSATPAHPMSSVD